MEFDKNMAQKVAEPAQTEYAATKVLAPSKDGTLRFCVDYRSLNALTKRDSYPILKMNKRSNCLGQGAVFSTIDANSGYRYVVIDKGVATRHRLHPTMDYI